jgi:hypothetical protein
MNSDPIVEEVRRHRQEYARQFNYDSSQILSDLTRRAAAHQKRLVSFPPKSAEARRTA